MLSKRNNIFHCTNLHEKNSKVQMKGTWAGKRTKVSRSRDGEEFSLKIKKGSSKHRGVREKRETSSIWLKINFLMNWKISFKNSYFIIIFAKQVQRGLWTIKKSPSFHWAHPRLRTFSMLEWNWSELNPNLWQREEECVRMWIAIGLEW